MHVLYKRLMIIRIRNLIEHLVDTLLEMMKMFREVYCCLYNIPRETVDESMLQVYM